jgi:LysM repeat protein
MPLGTPEALNTFLLAGFRLEATAPEEVSDSVEVALKTWWFKDNPKATQQVGRANPGPVDMRFKLNGPDSLNVAQFLKKMASERKEIPFAWAGYFNLKGRIKNVHSSITQHIVTISLTFEPTEDLNRDKGSSSALTATIDHTQAIVGLLDSLQSLADGLKGMLADIKGIITTVLSPVTDFLATVDAVTSILNMAIADFVDIASMPFQLLGQIESTISGALDTYQGARDAITTIVLEPAIPLVSGTAQFLVNSLGLSMLVNLDDAQTSLGLMKGELSPPPTPYTVLDEDTLQSIAIAHGVVPGDILQSNPGLSDQIAPGQTVLIPNG